AQKNRTRSRLVPRHWKLLSRARRLIVSPEANHTSRPVRWNRPPPRPGPRQDNPTEIRDGRKSATSQQLRNNRLHKTRTVQPDNRTQHPASARGERKESNHSIRGRGRARQTPRLHSHRSLRRHSLPQTSPRRSREILETHRHKRRDHGSHRRMDMGTTPRARTRPPLELADKQLSSKRQLEIRLSKLKILDTPKLRLEQYPVSSETADELLYMAGFEHNDLEGRIIDLGTGTGRLAIGAALMSPAHVVGVDV